VEAKEGIVWSESRRQQLPLVIFLVLCLNLVIAPAVYAAAEGTLERRRRDWCTRLGDVGAYGLLVCRCFSAGALLMSIVRNTTRAIRMTLVLWC